MHVKHVISSSNASIQKWVHYNHYQKINYVVYLIEIIWQRENPNLATYFQKFRIGIPNSHDVDGINSRYIFFNIVTTTYEFKPILLTSNLLWIAFNCSHDAKLFAMQRESPLIQFHVHVTRGCHSTLFAPKHQSFNYLHDDKIIRLPMILKLVVGIHIIKQF
jgi:hypothetical protein